MLCSDTNWQRLLVCVGSDDDDGDDDDGRGWKAPSASTVLPSAPPPACAGTAATTRPSANYSYICFYSSSPLVPLLSAEQIVHALSLPSCVSPLYSPWHLPACPHSWRQCQRCSIMECICMFLCVICVWERERLVLNTGAFFRVPTSLCICIC